MNVSASPRSRERIREMAKWVREQLDMKDRLEFPIVEVIELLAADDEEEFDYEIVSPGEMIDTYGTTNTYSNIMKIRENVYEGAIQSNPRDRFTLCHEFGHWFLHQPESVSFARGSIPKYCDPEWQANTFAAELMVPYYLIDGMSVEEIVEKCGVSYSCASIQMKYI